jgi:hypothetical protein
MLREFRRLKQRKSYRGNFEIELSTNVLLRQTWPFQKLFLPQAHKDLFSVRLRRNKSINTDLLLLRWRPLLALLLSSMLPHWCERLFKLQVWMDP